MGGKVVRVIAGIIVVLVIVAGVALGFNPFGSNRPEGVDSDSSEVRSVTLSGEDYEVVDFEDDLYVLSPDVTEVEVLDEGETRQFMSRNKDVLWVTPETAESLGIE